MPPLRSRVARALAALATMLALLAAATATAAPVRTPHVEAELVAAATALVPGQPLPVALRLKMEPGWHTYWRNPGDSGLPTTLAWTLPGGVTAGPLEWPTPQLQRVGPLANFGYEGEILLPTTLQAAASLARGSAADLKARADWLVCKEICIPEGVDLSLSLPVAPTASPDARWAGPLAAARAALPRPLAGGWQASAEGQGERVRLTLRPPAGAADPGQLYFFPYAETVIEPALPQVLAREGNAYMLTLPVASNLTAAPARLAGVLVASQGLGSGGPAAEIDVPLAGAIKAGARPAAAAAPVLNLSAPGGAGANANGPGASGTGAGASGAGAGAAGAPGTASGIQAPSPGFSGAQMTLMVAIAFAFLGGLILNLMPCVFPVLSIKVLGFAEHHDRKPTLRREAVAYSVGVVLSFVALGLGLAALRATGEQLGWGFQLQSPGVVTALAVLFFVLALNLSGVFEFGGLVPSLAGSWSARNRTLDAFGSGVLAVVVASPCTAPFMGAALGFAFAGSAVVTLAVFVALGLGMALPYVLLAWFPGWRRRLPKPGPWLARFKELLAFPLYGTVIWLAWVLGAQRDNDAVSRLLVALLGVGFALWAWRIARGGGARVWALVAGVVLAGSAVAAWPLFAGEDDAAPKLPVAGGAGGGSGSGSAAGVGQSVGVGAAWIDFSPAQVGELIAAGRPVFVDFTAAWCVTCQVNKRLVLNTPDVREAFAQRNVALLRADWTRRDATITRALADLGRNGVPVYVLYRPGKSPLLLPEVLQKSDVTEALGTL